MFEFRVWIHIGDTGGGGGIKFGFGRDVPLQNLKVDPYKCQFFKKKWLIHMPIYAQLWAKFWAKSPNFSKIGSNLGKFWKINPFIYQILQFIRGHSYNKRLILLLMLAAHPSRVFCTRPIPQPPPQVTEHGGARLVITYTTLKLQATIITIWIGCNWKALCSLTRYIDG